MAVWQGGPLNPSARAAANFRHPSHALLAMTDQNCIHYDVQYEAADGEMVDLILLMYTPREDRAARAYETWLRGVDDPFFNDVPGIANDTNWKITSAADIEAARRRPRRADGRRRDVLLRRLA